MLKFYEFFAGGGMARAGLGESWSCLFANDFDHKKGKTYSLNWGQDDLQIEDIKKISPDNLPDQADLAWASFPCQDLSLAGGGAGLKGERSGTFWPFWELMTSLQEESRAPRMIVLENVCGTLTSHKGKDFAAICKALSKAKYRFGAVVVDASLFVPQSRPRLFIVAVREDQPIPNQLISEHALAQWHTSALQKAAVGLPPMCRNNWIWWNLPQPEARNSVFADLVEDNPASVEWHSVAETRQLLSMMSKVNKDKVAAAKKANKKMVGCIYKRTRRDENGNKVQRAEVRFDDIAGCLRTPAGGSSRQLILVVEGNKIRSRLLSSRESARLMGLPDSYALPEKYNEAYHLTGDGVVVPVVRFLSENIFETILSPETLQKESKAA